MDRAGLPLRTGPDSVDLVIAESGGGLGLRGELGVAAAIATVAGLVCGGLVSVVTLVFGQFSWGPVLGTAGGVFGVAAVVLAWQVLAGGIVRGVIERRVPGRSTPRPGYLSWEEVRVAWPVVWDVPRAARANGVRTRPRTATGAGGREAR